MVNLTARLTNFQSPKSSVDDQLEASIADVLRNSLTQPSLTQPKDDGRMAMLPLPDYVSHVEHLEPINKLTAQAVVAQFENAAKTIEDMRGPLKEWAEAHQRAIDQLGAAMSRIDETAKHVRDLGKGTFEGLQKSALAIAEVLRTCNEIIDKIDKPVL